MTAGLDTQTRAALDLMASFGSLRLDAPMLRQLEKAGLPDLRIERALVGSIEDLRIRAAAGHEIPIRIYRPKAADRGGEPPAVLLYFHGGGHTLGSLDGWDGLCCQLTQQSGHLLVAVDYRLAPEHPFPAGPEDCYAALEWVAAHGAVHGGDGARIRVAGDSAGGNLSAVLCLMTRDRHGPPIEFQALLYPGTDGRAETASRRRNGQGYLLTIEMMDWFTAQYLSRPEDRQHPYVAPAKAQSHAGLPPALIVTAEFDPLLDEGAGYAALLRAAGVPVEYRCVEGTIHGFVGLYRMIDKGRQAIACVAERLRRLS